MTNSSGKLNGEPKWLARSSPTMPGPVAKTEYHWLARLPPLAAPRRLTSCASTRETSGLASKSPSQFARRAR